MVKRYINSRYFTYFTSRHAGNTWPTSVSFHIMNPQYPRKCMSRCSAVLRTLHVTEPTYSHTFLSAFQHILSSVFPYNFVLILLDQLTADNQGPS